MMPTGAELKMFVSLLAVLALTGGCLWALKRGVLRAGAFGGRSAVTVETAVSLGERRSLVIVVVEGRRLLLGATPASLSLLTELAPPTERIPS